jgi:2-polyprenyl-3-methyl-5-hydroxy-6-metoxy-1,4-benzoquinol methylase
MPFPSCPLCGESRSRHVATLHEKPAHETDFNLEPYSRSIRRCLSCDVYFNVVDATISYDGDYNAATYDNKLKTTFDRIVALPPEKSDNKQRVQRVLSFVKQHGLDPATMRVLDVGSGLAVFPAELLKYGVHISCIDPDPLSVAHAASLGITASQATIETFSIEETFDLITFNKVLEHVGEPIPALQTAKGMLSDNGCIYIELPDAKGAELTNDFVNREEFFLGHHVIFTPMSVEYLVSKAGCVIIALERIHEPSDKYTLYAFLKRE